MKRYVSCHPKEAVVCIITDCGNLYVDASLWHRHHQTYLPELRRCSQLPDAIKAFRYYKLRRLAQDSYLTDPGIGKPFQILAILKLKSIKNEIKDL